MFRCWILKSGHKKEHKKTEIKFIPVQQVPVVELNHISF